MTPLRIWLVENYGALLGALIFSGVGTLSVVKTGEVMRWIRRDRSELAHDELALGIWRLFGAGFLVLGVLTLWGR